MIFAMFSVCLQWLGGIKTQTSSTRRCCWRLIPISPFPAGSGPLGLELFVVISCQEGFVEMRGPGRCF